MTSVEHLFSRLDTATSHDSDDAICEAVKTALIDEIGSGRLELPDEFLMPSTTGYARRLLHKTDDYAIVVMVWGPGQGTPIHDHDGNWCVECVYSGAIRVHSYDLVGTPDDEVVEFREAEQVAAHKGMAGSLIPPFDYHVIENPHADVAVTVHVYGGEMHGCYAYAARDDGRYQRERKALSYT